MDNTLPGSRKLLNVTSEMWSSAEKECEELRKAIRRAIRLLRRYEQPEALEILERALSS
jgi:hypothetical protein